jgi:hypothetical protein
MNALPEEELRRRQAHAPELLRVPDDFECNFCNHGDPSSGILSDMGMFGQLLPNTRYGYF